MCCHQISNPQNVCFLLGSFLYILSTLSWVFQWIVLLLKLDVDEGGAMNRIGGTCSKDNIVIFQGPTTPLPSGIPTYTVQILNVCVAGCSISNIHVRCGWFSSARLINPRLFRRIFFDDCLVNNGDALGPGESLSFQYANSFRYPLSVLSVSCFWRPTAGHGTCYLVYDKYIIKTVTIITMVYI